MVFQTCPHHPRLVRVYRLRRGRACRRPPCTYLSPCPSKNFHLILHHSITPWVIPSHSPRPVLQHTPSRATRYQYPYPLLRGRTLQVSSKCHPHLVSGPTRTQRTQGLSLSLHPPPSFPHLLTLYHQCPPCLLLAPISLPRTNRASLCTRHLLTLIPPSTILCIHMHGRYFNILRIHPHLRLI